MNLNIQPTELCCIMGEYGSDKGNKDITTSHHNYTLVYYQLFKNMKNNNIRVFELGLGTNNLNVPSNMGISGQPGASLHGWAKFFPNAKVFGADIDRAVLFQTDRIKTYYCDQLNMTDIKKMWSNQELWEPFDIIIDDGLHDFDANVCFFENSIHKLKMNGYYIIEDIYAGPSLSKWDQKIKEWSIIYPHLIFKFIKVPSQVNNCDNNLIIAHYSAS